MPESKGSAGSGNADHDNWMGTVALAEVAERRDVRGVEQGFMNRLAEGLPEAQVALVAPGGDHE